MNFRSIYFRLIAWYGALVILVVLGFGAFTYHSLQRRLTEEMVQTLTRRAEQIRDHILNGNPSTAALASTIEAIYSPEANSRFIRILRPDGSTAYVSGRPKDELFHPSQIPLPDATIYRAATHQEPLASGFHLLMIRAPEEVRGNTWIIEMGAPTDQIESAVHELLRTLLFTLPLLIVVAAAGGYFLVRRSLKPVEDIRATAEQITFGNLSSRLPVVATGDALEHLSLTLNQMLERLEDAYHQASRFSADASHELRTPLTIMRTELESIVQEPSLTDSWRERFGSVLEEAEYLSRITESLFAISRLDAGEAKMEDMPLDLAQVVVGTAEQMLLMAEEKQIAIDMQAITSVPVEGDYARLKQVVVNLLDNAIKYTPRGGKIHIEVIAAHPKAVLIIRDNGIGIAADALPHVFKRFYRAEKVRSRAMGGAGLGLAIVRSIIQAHGGTVDIQSEEGMGTQVTIELPLQPEK
jgi:heavy metal sensor kinase